ncbi:MAG: hypothetical protein M1828_006541 [Chrysothrix sp. TS-e1954]|nr:MAG: hypothetical protein M1828_006541 [Chrysothrix sp. TS-e1954]
MTDLQELLFSKLRATSASGVAQTNDPAPSSRPPSGFYSPQPQPGHYEVPSVSSPLMSPPIRGPQPRHDDVLSLDVSTANTPMPDQTSNRTTNLLNLLKFNQPTGQQTPLTRASDSPAARVAPVTQAAGTASATEKPQDMLLNLLKRTTASSPSPITVADPLSPSSPSERREREKTPVRIFGEPSSEQTTPFEAPTARNGSVFSYVNPFEQLSASTPRKQLAASSPRNQVRQHDQQKARASEDATLNSTSSALNGVAKQANEDATNALLREERRHARDSIDAAATDEAIELKDAVHTAALEIREDLKEPTVRQSVEDTMPGAMAEAFKDTIDQVAKEAEDTEAVADTWESADANETEARTTNGHSIVQVYNLPMKPFVSISVHKTPSSKLRDDVVLKIASMKRDFDQVDRALIAASPNHIVYAMAKGGGFRIIRQDDGSNLALFRKPENQIFNVSISAPSASFIARDSEHVLATDVNGAVYWVPVAVDREKAADDEAEKKAFCFPATLVSSEDAPAAQLKTRAKKSSRHPEFFAIARGKNISFIQPALAASERYANRRTRVVDSEKYLAEQGYRVSTGKSGKDFSFSEDDSVLVSLDKAGKIKFWDIAEYLEELVATGEQQPARSPVSIKAPIMALAMSMANDKSGPTSIQFLDKDRPMTKGIALRYILIGLKQNHTLQLWDLGLGKAVQELNLPHDSEIDAICSVSYHSKSGVIAVGHPTRNSLYLIHLSAPRYNLPSMTQANFVMRLASKDLTLPRPESTAIMSGIREISLASIGDLRSLDIVSPTTNTADKEDVDEETILEVYVMHSRGSSALALKRQDLGWGIDGKVVNALDAVKENMIDIQELKATPEVSTEDVTPKKDVANGNVTASTIKVLPKPLAKDNLHGPREASPLKKDVKKGTEQAVTSIEQADAKQSAGVAKEVTIDKVRDLPSPTKMVSEILEPATKATPARPKADNLPEAIKSVSQVEPKAATTARDEAPVMSKNAQIENKPQRDLLNDRFDELYRKINDDKRVQDATGTARQDAVLRLVASTLTDNVEKSLSRIINGSVEGAVIPAISDVISAALKGHVSETLTSSLRSSITRDIGSGLPTAVTKALQSHEALQSISDQVARKLSNVVQAEIASNLSKTVTPAMKSVATDLASTMAAEFGRHVESQTNKVELRLQHDAEKIDRLTALAESLTATMQNMASAQSELHQEIFSLRTHVQDQRNAAPPLARPQAPSDPEVDSIAELMSTGKLEEGTIKWLQSSRQAELFDKLFAKYSPTYMRELSQMVVLSTVAAASTSFEDHLGQRLAYLEMAMSCIDAESPDITSYIPKVMEVLVSRVHAAYMQISQVEPNSPVLARLFEIVNSARKMKEATG